MLSENCFYANKRFYRYSERSMETWNLSVELKKVVASLAGGSYSHPQLYPVSQNPGSQPPVKIFFQVQPLLRQRERMKCYFEKEA